MDCPRCEGSGKCVECDGVGHIECPGCSGKGTKTTSRGVSYNCKACSGNGKVECSAECSSCNGTGEITEAFQKETRDKYRPKFANYSPNSKVVWPLIIINIVVFMGLKFAPWDVTVTFMLSSQSFQLGHYWALITPSFIHFDTFHILLNMVFLGYYGPPLEGLLGKRRFLLTYLFAALTACSMSYLGNIVIHGYAAAGVGASGPLFGIMGAYIAIHKRWRMVSSVDVRQLTNWAGILLLVGFALEASDFNFIDNWAHLGGLLGGLFLNFVLPRPRGAS